MQRGSLKVADDAGPFMLLGETVLVPANVVIIPPVSTIRILPITVSTIYTVPTELTHTSVAPPILALVALTSSESPSDIY